MRYIYTGGEYREFRGYVFIGERPVTITDKATLAAICRMHDFKPAEETHEEEKTETKTEVLKATVKGGCPKCGKVLARGMFMHQRWCRGV